MRPCAQCGTPFLPAHGNTRLCSTRCQNLRRESRRMRACATCGAQMWHSRDGAKTPICRPCRSSTAKPKSDPIQVWDCAQCGARCERPATRGQRPSLCPACRTSDWITPTRRRALYERDSWVCWLCISEVDPSLIGTRSIWRPSLDHILPRAEGGGDEDDNLRLAHMWCNTTRSDGRKYQPEDFRGRAA